MPIYTFKCPECGHTCDKLRKHGGVAPDCETCPAAPAMERQLSAPGFDIRGHGVDNPGMSIRGTKRLND